MTQINPIRKKELIILLFIFLFKSLSIYAQSEESYKKQWTNLKNETNISFANSNIRFAKEKVPDIDIQTSWETTAWKGEKVHTQIIMWSRRNISKFTYQLTDISNSKEKIEEKNITLSPLRYVWTDGYFGNGCGKRITSQTDSSLVADVIDTEPISAMKANTLYPFWLSIVVPETISEGTYTGNLIINADQTTRLKISIRVLRHILPPASKWQFDLDLWQYPVAIAKEHKVALWSDEHFKIMKPYFTLLASAGQKCITMSIIDGGNQTVEISPAMIKWIKQKNASWVYDYTLFDKYISFVMDCGITKRINCYTMVPWGESFNYHDEATGKDTSLHMTPFTQEYKVFWQTMLKDFTKHLKEKKWFQKTSIAMDERELKSMLEVIKIIKEVDPKWKISLAGRYHEELVKELDDYSVFKTYTFSKEELSFRNVQGMSSTFYTSCEGEKPNMFSFSPPAESVWMGWYAASKGFSGYLRWAYNFWNKNPLNDTRGVFPAGDQSQIYPGPRSSVRFEKLIEGIQDFEKIRILQSTFIKESNYNKLNEINKMLSSFDLEILNIKTSEEIITNAKILINKF